MASGQGAPCWFCLSGDSDFDIDKVCLKIDTEALAEARRAHDNEKQNFGKGASKGRAFGKPGRAP